MYLQVNFEIFVLFNPFRFLAYFIIESLDKKKKRKIKGTATAVKSTAREVSFECSVQDRTSLQFWEKRVN